jgi:5-methyltetrahydropteroyltriglutamate--homocysteine methyltransferase
MPGQTPPFRADHVGSLLRPPPVKAARAKIEDGSGSAADLKRAEDAAIDVAIRKQEAVGIQAVTDGEIRRGMWHWDFIEHLDGVELRHFEGTQFSGTRTKPKALYITGKIGFTSHPLVDHFRYVKDRTKQTAKMTIPSPCMIMSMARDWRPTTDRNVYPHIFDAFADLAKAYQKAIRAFHDAGCRYLQIDECNLPMLCDPSYHEKARARGDDAGEMLKAFCDLIDASLEERPKDMVITMHTCRGNFISTWMAEGGYEPVAERMFSLKPDGFFVEYDSERAGGFEPLRHVPKDKMIVLGLVSSKTGQLESPDDIKRRVSEASRYVDLDRLCISPQCGFASSEEGNVLSEDEQWAKLAFVRDVADEIWR